MTGADGDVYDGEWKDGSKHGRGAGGAGRAEGQGAQDERGRDRAVAGRDGMVGGAGAAAGRWVGPGWRRGWQ